MNFKLSFISVLILVFLNSCSSITPDQNANAAVQSGSIIFKDDFSNPSSGWETWSEPSGSMVAYQGGGLRIYVNEKQYDYWSRPGKRVSDARLEVDVIKLGGSDDNDFGLICRFQDGDNFYAGLASSDGYTGILKVKEGKYQILSGGQMKFADAVRIGEAQNHVRFDCAGSDLTLYINGKQLMTVKDSDLKTGEIGVLAGTGDKTGADLYFDNFWAYKP